MTRITSFLDALAKDDSGATMLEYSLLIGLITAGAVAIVAGGGDWVSTQWTTLRTNVGATPTAW